MTNDVLKEMVPKGVPELMSKTKRGRVYGEYSRSVTVMFIDACGLEQTASHVSPGQLISLLNQLYNLVNDYTNDTQVCTVHAINNSYLVVSGAPYRVGNKHAPFIADMALNLQTGFQNMLHTMPVKKFGLRIGINTGPCVGGIFGNLVPRFSLFGETINIAARMRNSSIPNSIHITANTYRALKKHKGYVMAFRGHIPASQENVPITTYWLLAHASEEDQEAGTTQPSLDISVELGDWNEDAESQMEQYIKPYTNKFGMFNAGRYGFVPHTNTAPTESSALYLMGKLKGNEDE